MGNAGMLAALMALVGVAFAEPTGCPDFAVERPRGKAWPIVQATAFGLSSASSNNASAVTAALAEAKRRGVHRVVLASGTYHCHDAKGIVAEGLEDVEIDGKGATLVFWRPSDFRDQPQWDNAHDGANFILKGCKRVHLTNLNIDWDWERDPLGGFVTVADVHLGGTNTFDSSLDLRFEDYKRHPLYGKPMPVQTLYVADPSRDRLGVGENNYFGQSEGHFGCRMKWLSPNLIRVWPYAKSDCGPFSSQYESRVLAKSNYWAVSRRKTGDFLRLAHYYYGKNCFVVEDGEHIAFRKVNVLSCRGMGWVFDGTVHHVAVVDCNVLPPHRLGKKAKGPAKRPFTTTCDVVHVSHGSRGWFKFENYRAAMNQDDLYNFHDRSSWVRKTGPRALTVTQKRGIKYFEPRVGDELELLGKDYSTTGFRAKVRTIDGETMTVDRDIPDRFLADSIVFDRARDTGHIIIRNCVHEGPSGRCCILAPNVTVDGLVIRDGQSMAMKLQSGTTTDKWSEGYGCTNVVVRNCSFEDVNGRMSKMYGVVSDVFVGINYENGQKTGVKPVDTLVGDILLENNAFVRPRGTNVFVYGASKVVERGSQVVSADTIPDVRFERISLHAGGEAEIPRLAPFSWELKDGLLHRNGKPDYWIGNGSDLGASQATPVGLWLAWLQGTKMLSVCHSTTRFAVSETNGTLAVKGDLRPSAVPWLREAIRLGFLTQSPEGHFSPAGGAWRPFLVKYPALAECIYDSGHHMGADAATPIGRASLVEKRAPLFTYGDRTGYFLPELNREPGPDPYNDRVKRGFRVWAERKYGSLAEANRVWKTSFARWDDVILRHTVEGAPSPDVYRTESAEVEVRKVRNRRGVIRQAEARETPELYMDWMCYVQEDTLVFTRAEFADVRRLAPNSHPGIDLRAHQSNRDNYSAYDPTEIDKLEDVFYIHFVFKATDYQNRPVNDKALADLICWPLFDCKYFRSVSAHPIVNSEDIITQTIAAAPSHDAMARNDLARFADAKWELKDGGEGCTSFSCEFTVPKRFENDYADGSRRFSLCGYRTETPGIWFRLNGKQLPLGKGAGQFYQADASSLLNYGGRNVLAGAFRRPVKDAVRPDCFVLSQDMLGGLMPFGEKQYTAMFWSYMMNAHSSAIVWNWNSHEKLRLWEPALARKLSAAAGIALPDLRTRRNKVAFLYAYTGGKGLPSPREGRHYRLMNWVAALEFSGHRFDAIGEEEFRRDADRYPVVVAPDQALVKEATLAAAKRCVEGGGRLIVTPTSFEKTFTRYEKTDFAAFAAAHADRVTVIGGEPSVEELMAKLDPLLPEPDLAVTFAPSAESPCIERVLAGEAKRKVLYLANWGGLDHDVTVALPAECRGWKVTPLHGTFAERNGALTTTVVGSLGVSAAILTAPGADVPRFDVSPTRQRIIAKVRELNELSKDATRKRRVLFPKDMLGAYRQGELSSDTICGKEIYPYLLDRAKAFGYEVDELEPVKWTAEVLAKHDLVMMLCAMDNQQWTPIAKDLAHQKRFQKAIDGYVKGGGSLFCQIYSGRTGCANMAMTWRLTPALWKFKCVPYADPQDAEHCGFGDPRQILTENIAPHAITEGVRSIQLGFVNPILCQKGCELRPLVRLTPTAGECANGVAMAAQEYGKGRLFVNFEPMVFQPFRIEHADNAALLENVFGWLSRTPVTQEMRDAFKRGLFLTESDLKRVVQDEND